MEPQKIKPIIGRVPSEYFEFSKEEQAEFNKKAFVFINAFMGFVAMYFHSRN